MANSIRSRSVRRGATSARLRRAPKRSRGISLLIALIVLIVLGGSLLTAVLSATQLERARERTTAEALLQAKQALIAYAAAYADTHSEPSDDIYYVPGYLPCPEVTSPTSPGGEGHSTPCGTLGTSLLGRLPWAELGIEPPKDGAGQCLWYAVSSTFKRRSAGTGTMLNWDTAGLFDIVAADPDSAAAAYIAGPDPARRAVAVVFAPGTPLPGKSALPHANAQQCGGSYTSSDYLDASDGVDNAAMPSTANTPTSFVVAQRSANFNDQLVYITAAEVFEAVAKTKTFTNSIRGMMRDAAGCLAGFARYHQSALTPDDERLPWAAVPAISTTSLTAYDSNANYRDSFGAKSGRLPFDVRNSCRVTLGLTSCPSTERELLDDDITYCSRWNEQDQEWYRNWKDQLFYAVSFDHRPDSGSATEACGSSPSATCLRMNGADAYAAVLLFSGRALAGKQRSTLDDKQQLANYLEGRNASNHPNNLGDGDYQAGAASTSFNDIAVCIKHDVADDELKIVEPCPAAL